MTNPLITVGRWFRFDLRLLLTAVALLAFGLTALKLSTHGWAVAVTTLTTAVFLFAVVGWIHCRDEARTFWAGFAVCGGGYLALLWVLTPNVSPYMGSSFGSPQPNYMATKTSTDDLATTQFLDVLFRKFNPTIERMYPQATNICIFEAASIYGVPSFSMPSPPPAYSAQPPPNLPANSTGASAYQPPYREIEPDDSETEPVTSKPTQSNTATQSGTATQSSAPASDSTYVPASASSTSWSPTPWSTTPQPAPTPFPDLSSGYERRTIMRPVDEQVTNADGSVRTVTRLVAEEVVSTVPLGGPTYDPQLLATRLTYFPRIGHCLFALIVGWVGGRIATVIARDTRRVAAPSLASH